MTSTTMRTAPWPVARCTRVTGMGSAGVSVPSPPMACTATPAMRENRTRPKAQGEQPDEPVA
jgi:hypothetical protein